MGRKFHLSSRKCAERKCQAKKIADGTNRRGRPCKKKYERISSEKKSCFTLNTFTKEHLKLPTGWSYIDSNDEGLVLTKVMSYSSQQPVITHCITIKRSGHWQLSVHAKELDTSKYDELKNFGILSDIETVNSLINVVDLFNVCPAHPDVIYVNMLKEKKGKIMSPRGTISARLDEYGCVRMGNTFYEATVRPESCVMLTMKNKCSFCNAYRPNLRSIYSNFQQRKDASPRCKASSKANYRYLTTPQRHKRFVNLRVQATKAKQDATYMRKCVQESIQQREVQVDEVLNDDLSAIMDEHQEEIEKKYSPDSFQRLFWEEQIKARGMQKSSSMKWHPMMIRWCLNLKLLSPSAYSLLKSSKILKLPSERTLRDYTHWVKAKPGFQAEVDLQLKEEAQLASTDLNSYVTLVYDEVKVQEGLVYDKESCVLIGFVQVDDMSSHMNSEASISDSIATHMLVFMVRGLFSALKFPYAQFPTTSLSGGTLYPLVWECIAHLEMLGFKVLALTADGASSNRKFFN